MGQGDDKTLDATKQTPSRVAVFLLLLHIVLAAFYWWLTPKGFPINHPRFWSAAAWPTVIILISVFGRIGLDRNRFAYWAPVSLGFLSGLWIAGAITLRVVFPDSITYQWLAGIALGLQLVRSSFRLPSQQGGLVYASMIIGGIVGVHFALAQVPSTPSTRPLNPTLANDKWGKPIDNAEQLIDLAANAKLINTGRLEVRN